MKRNNFLFFATYSCLIVAVSTAQPRWIQYDLWVKLGATFLGLLPLVFYFKILHLKRIRTMRHLSSSRTMELPKYDRRLRVWFALITLISALAWWGTFSTYPMFFDSDTIFALMGLVVGTIFVFELLLRSGITNPKVLLLLALLAAIATPNFSFRFASGDADAYQPHEHDAPSEVRSKSDD